MPRRGVFPPTRRAHTMLGMAVRNQTIRTLLFGFIASISACGLVGVYILALGNMGSTEGKIIVTTLTVAAIFLLGLFASVPTARRCCHPLGPVALCFLIAPLVLTVWYIWAERYISSYEYGFFREYERFLGFSWTAGITLPILGLVAIARLKRQYEWIRITTVCVGLLLSAQISLSIFWDINVEEWYRGMGILAILTTCGLISLPILHRISSIPLVERVHTSKLEIALTCPRCSRAQVIEAGGAVCVACGLKINVEIEEEQCRRCGYPLYKIDSAVCPECGTPIARDQPPAARSSPA